MSLPFEGDHTDGKVLEFEAKLFSQLFYQAVDEIKILERTIKPEDQILKRRIVRKKDLSDERKMTFYDEADYEAVILPVSDKLKRDRYFFLFLNNHLIQIVS